MKTVILAGGFGTRLSEETEVKPKPMVEIGEYPILWHIMKIYSHYGFNDFIICLGYKGYVIKEYFANYFLHKSDLTVDLKNNSIKFENTTAEPWNIRLLDTGSDTMTGGRIKRAFRYTDNEAFMLTYGDGVADINLDALLSFHKRQKTYATVTAVQPTGRFGSLSVDPASNRTSFVEKPPGDNAWINGGFFVVEPEAVDFIQGDDIVWERDPLEKIARINELSAYKHSGFWHPMDTLRDKKYLNELWNSGNPPWRVWNE